VAATNYKLKTAVIDIGGTDFQDQITTFNINNDTDDGETFDTFGGPNAAFVEAADASFTLEITAFADWSLGGISDYLWAHDGETVTFQVDHHPDVVGSHVRVSGQLQIKAPSMGGEIRTTETTETTLVIVGKPTYTRIG
jgi:hypothetical protein